MLTSWPQPALLEVTCSCLPCPPAAERRQRSPSEFELALVVSDELYTKINGTRRSLKHSGSHIDASHSRQYLVQGERLVLYEVNAAMSSLTRCENREGNVPLVSSRDRMLHLFVQSSNRLTFQNQTGTPEDQKCRRSSRIYDILDISLSLSIYICIYIYIYI